MKYEDLQKEIIRREKFDFDDKYGQIGTDNYHEFVRHFEFNVLKDSDNKYLISFFEDTDIEELYESPYVICDYLKSLEEVDIFFNSIWFDCYTGIHIDFKLPTGEYFNFGQWNGGDPMNDDPDIFENRDEIPEEDLILSKRLMDEENHRLKMLEIERQEKKILLPRSIYVSKQFIKMATGLSNKQLTEVDSESFGYNNTLYNLENGINISKKVIQNTYN